MTVCLDTAGAEAARPYVERAKPEHPSLVDVAHLVDERFGVVNIPNSVWIDEAGVIVRPAEPAWAIEVPPASAPPPEAPAPAPPPAVEAPDPMAAQIAEKMAERMAEMMAAASQIVSDRDAYVAALRDWAERGAGSAFALPPDEVVARSGRRGVEESTAAAEFELAQHLYRSGDHEAARAHFREAHRLQPDNWTYKRQAWSLEPSALEGPLARFWQGPLPGREAEWAYPGDWVKDATTLGPANYYPRFES